MSRKARIEKIFLFLFILMVSFKPILFAKEDGLVAWWKFNSADGNRARDAITGIRDSIEGNFKYTQGVSGTALKLDGFTTCVIRAAKNVPQIGDSFSLETWIALAAYPWNWCPIIAQKDEGAGFYFAVGPRGQIALKVAQDGRWLECASPDFSVRLREWAHVVAVHDSSEGITLYVDGKQIGKLKIVGSVKYARNADLRIGMNYNKMRPSDIHRDHGTLPAWFSLDGIIDEVKIYNKALNSCEVLSSYQNSKPATSPDLPQWLMPAGPPGPGRFGAYYCKLHYYDEWDSLWPVADDADVVVRFDRSGARVVFWRGTRYSPVWVTENGLWMADQSVEAWGVGDEDKEGCFEHMQDRQCRYSHVRIIESNNARVVVHWRYAPVSSHNHLWGEDEKTGFACWVDEYYYIYPDEAGVRNVSWKKGTLGDNRQFQETLPLLQPGQVNKDVINIDFVTVRNYQGETWTFSFVKDPKVKNKWEPKNFNMQLVNLKSKEKPFIAFEPGSKMYIFDMDVNRLMHYSGNNHWPVGQMPCDGRTSQAPDRPSHFLGFPITDPPIHEKDGIEWWNGLYGLTDKGIEEVAFIASSWINSPKTLVKGNWLVSQGYDMGQRAYLFHRQGIGNTAEIKFNADKKSPLCNPALVIRDWGESEPELKINGERIERGKTFRYGYRHNLDGSTDLIIWLDLRSATPVTLEVRGVE